VCFNVSRETFAKKGHVSAVTAVNNADGHSQRRRGTTWLIQGAEASGTRLADARAFVSFLRVSPASRLVKQREGEGQRPGRSPGH
jgi:hypothetical protein